MSFEDVIDWIFENFHYVMLFLFLVLITAMYFLVSYIDEHGLKSIVMAIWEGSKG